MNSLSYLSRQFDVVASATTPPSTPTSERRFFVGGDHGRKRNVSLSGENRPAANTWSTTFLFSPSSSMKRSYSSPADFITLAQGGSTSPTISLKPEIRPESGLHALVRRVFFVRVMVVAWNTLRAALASLLELTSIRQRQIAGSIAVAEKDEETADEASPPASPVLLRPPTHALRSHTDPSLEPKLDPSTGISLPSMASSTSHTSDPPSTVSTRASTPVLAAKRPPFHLPKTLVLDLDETLIHSTSRPMPSLGSKGIFGLGSLGRRNKGAGHVVEVVLGGRSTLYHVYKRPFVDFFLRTVSSWYTLVIFTASMQEYANPVIDWLDAGRGILENRMFRDSCTQLPNGSYTKDLALVEPDLGRVCLIDNSPVSYTVYEANGIPIEGWTHDPSDEALLDLLPVLDSLRFTSDVRRVLALRCAGSVSS